MKKNWRQLKRIWYRSPRWWQGLRRDVRVFIYLCPWRALITLLSTLFLASYLFQYLHLRLEGPISFIKAMVAIINMVFLQLSFADMPANGTLDYFVVIIPLIGLPLVSFFGLRVYQVLRVFFVRGERGQEWQETLIKYTVDHHIIVCGLGRVGYRVAKQLKRQYGKTVVGINDTQTRLVEELMADDIPVLIGDVGDIEVLNKAGIDRAQVVVACTDSDWINLETAIRARKLRPTIRIVLRQFEDDLSEEMQRKFQVDAVISRSAAAAMSFVYAAIGGEIVETFNLGRRSYVLARVPLGPTSPMLGRTIGQVAEEQDVTVVCHHRGEQLTVEPDPATQLMCHDTMFIFTTVAEMLELIEYGVEQSAACQKRVLVCGLGNTGYRVAKNLVELSCNVVALDFRPRRLGGRLKEMGLPLKYGDLRWRTVLLDAGVKDASAIVACTADDMTNLQIVLQARALNPNIRVVMRIFDDVLGQQMRQNFGVNAAIYSTSALAAPDFVAAALDRQNIRQIQVGHSTQAITRLLVNASSLAGAPLKALQDEDDLTVLLHARNGQVDIPPPMTAELEVGDEIVVMATEDKLDTLNQRNGASEVRQPTPIE